MLFIIQGLIKSHESANYNHKKMKKETALQVLSLVKEKRTENYIQEVFLNVENYINSKSDKLDYNELISFIESQKSNKLGGVFIYINKALQFLKEELKSQKKATYN